MYFSKSVFICVLGVAPTNIAAFAPCASATARQSTSVLMGYLDDLSKDLYAEDDNPDVEATSRESTKMAKDQVKSYGPGSFQDFVDFNEFDGGDGQMGVAGDGNTKLEKLDAGPQLSKSKMMSAKNAWGSSTGYADELLKSNPKIDTARAQQLENWANQQEVRAKNQQLKEMTEILDRQQASADEDWRQLAKFGVERVQDFDMEEAFGPVVAGDEIEGVIQLQSQLNRVASFDINLRNPYMGFADFRAAFTSDTPLDWSVEPTQGSLKQREDTTFVLKFKPQGMGIVQGYLVIETEDFKKTWQVIGST
mmetsp:Transcript_15760/g.32071  ORF Transcript_15760/g.32071 Transcript_15760/m.32071 type:complete len:308 (-) Transcript_15760:391-1314(-)